nr:copper resistance protein CopC [Ardenticatenales bacterium]
PLDLPTTSPDDPKVAVVALPALEAGTYTVTWHTKSVDGHPLDGSYEFEIHFRQQIITMVVAGTVFSLMALLVFLRRARPEDLEEE